MGKHDLMSSASRRSTALDPDVQGPETQPVRKSEGGLDLSKLSPEDRGAVAKSLAEGAVKVAFEVVSTKCAIEKIKASADARVREIGAEIERANAETENTLKKMREENADWHSRFDKEAGERRAFLDRALAVLDGHPELSGAEKSEIVKTILEALHK